MEKIFRFYVLTCMCVLVISCLYISFKFIEESIQASAALGKTYFSNPIYYLGEFLFSLILLVIFIKFFTKQITKHLMVGALFLSGLYLIAGSYPLLYSLCEIRVITDMCGLGTVILGLASGVSIIILAFICDKITMTQK